MRSMSSSDITPGVPGTGSSLKIISRPSKSSSFGSGTVVLTAAVAPAAGTATATGAGCRCRLFIEGIERSDQQNHRCRAESWMIPDVGTNFVPVLAGHMDVGEDD